MTTALEELDEYIEKNIDDFDVFESATESILKSGNSNNGSLKDEFDFFLLKLKTAEKIRLTNYEKVKSLIDLEFSLGELDSKILPNESALDLESNRSSSPPPPPPLPPLKSDSRLFDEKNFNVDEKLTEINSPKMLPEMNSTSEVFQFPVIDNSYILKRLLQTEINLNSFGDSSGLSTSTLLTSRTSRNQLLSETTEKDLPEPTFRGEAGLLSELKLRSLDKAPTNFDPYIKSKNIHAINADAISSKSVIVARNHSNLSGLLGIDDDAEDSEEDDR